MRFAWPRSVGWSGGAILVWMVLSCTGARSEGFRFGIHSGFDRLVVSLPEDASYTARQDGNRVTIEADALGVVIPSGPGGRRIREISGGPKMLSFSVVPSARRRIWRSGDRLVIDVFEVAGKPAMVSTEAALPRPPTGYATKPSEAAPARAAPAGASPAGASPAGASPAGASPVATARAARVPAATAPSVASPPASIMVRADVPAHPMLANPMLANPTLATATLANTARPAPLPPGASIQLQAADEDFPLGSLLILAPQEVGAAAFFRSGVAHLIFDAPLPLDLAVLKDDPAYGNATADPLATAAHLLLKLPEGMRLLLSRQKDGWRAGFSRQDQKLDPIAISAQSDGLVFDAPSSASTVVIDDRQTGTTLLVGTQRKGMAHVSARRRTPEFLLPATWLGVVVDTASDRLELRAGPRGFTLRMGAGPALATAWPGSAEAAASEAAGLTRRFDFPDLPVPMLRSRLRDAMRDEAQAPALARHDARLRTAQAMLALGLDVESLAVLRAASSDDPASDVRDGPSLRAIAAGLAGGGDTSGTQDGPAFVSSAGTTDEDTFWQAVFRPPGPDAAQAAAALAATWKLALSYPETLRRQLLPRIADALLNGGQPEAAGELLRASTMPSLDLARAELARAQGHLDDAMSGFDRVALGADRNQGARARREAVELRLADHRLSPKDGAKALQSQIFAWRGDGRELALRLRVAALLEQSGAWRAALGALRDAEHLYPDAHDRLQEAQATLVRDLLKQDAASSMPPLELVALVGECADLLGQSPAGAMLAPVLIDKLLALDLPDRAEPILRRMIQNAASPDPKAELGLRLAELLLAKGDAPGASTALEATIAPTVTPALASRRILFKARLLTSIGDKEGALRLLDTCDLPEALDQKAALLEQLHDWKGAMAVLATIMQQRVDSSGMLGGAQADLVLRYASDAAQAGDMAALRQLRDGEGRRMAAGAQADLLRVLTQSPVRAVDDIPRASQELAVARALPATFAGLQGH